jgi:ATP/maltotriose-dependent transcriptional regulator MalT
LEKWVKAGLSKLYPGVPEASGRTRSIHSRAPLEPLTDREIEMLELVARGLCNQEICERSNLAFSPAKRHLRDVFAKLDESTRTAAIVKAQELGKRGWVT